jgi:ApaG protein
MKPSTNALLAFLTLAYPSAEAFTPNALSRTSTNTQMITANNHLNIIGYQSRSNSSNSRLFSSVYDDEEDSEEEDSDEEDSDDDDNDLPRSMQRSSGLSTSFPKLDPNDPNPPIKPRPGRYGFQSIEAEMDSAIPLSSLEQTMTPAQRQENLKIMRQIKNNDLADLRLRKDHAGWVDANNDLKARTKADPWFRVNTLIQEKYMLGEMEEVEDLKKLAEKLGGPPPGVKVSDRGYALHTDIFDIGLSAARAQSALEESILQERVQRGRVMAAERRKNMEKEQQAWEDMLTNPGEREDKEAKERRERTMKRIMGEIEEEQKKREERAKEILGQLPQLPTDNVSSLNSALSEAREDVKRLRKMRKEGRGLGEVSDDADLTFMNPEDRIKADSSAKAPKSDVPKGSAAKAREAAAAEAVGGRPRLPGDEDVTRGEITIPIESSSTTASGPLTVEVSSSYNTAQSDPPMRKHCFQYTIRITNNSPEDTIQLLSRRFEIQTVGSSMKDVVQGEGVTGRTPILKPGETFEYTSTAPLSVRPIATTIIAARMKGEYKYVTLAPGQETATEDQLKEGGNSSAQLGMFHFVFPEEQRVKPLVSYDEDDDEDEEDAKPVTKSDAKASTTRPSSVSPPAGSKTSASPASTLPGDSDMASGNISIKVSDASNVVSDNVRVQVSSVYRPERSDAKLDKHCFAYNVRITNESPKQNIQLVSRRFEIQTIGSETKDVVQGPGVTGRQPVLKPGESFEYTSTAPLSVKPMLDKTPVVARMEGEYNFVQLGDDGSTPLSSTPLKAKMEMFHFILPDLGTV